MASLIPLLHVASQESKVSPFSSISKKWIVIDVTIFLGLFLLILYAVRDLPGHPQNDDPFYVKPLATYFEKGELVLYKQGGRLAASMIAHLGVAWALCGGIGYSLKTLYLACILQQWVGIVFLYAGCLFLGCSQTLARMFALGYAVFPIFLGHAFTFMTDGPASAWMIISTVSLMVGWRKKHLGWILFASFGIAWGFWIRQTNLLLLWVPLLLHSKSIVIDRKSPSLKEAVAMYAIPLLALLAMESQLFVHRNWERFEKPDPWTWERLKFLCISGYGLCLLFGLSFLPWSVQLGWERRKMLLSLPRRTRMTLNRIMISVLIALSIPFIATQGRACITNSTGCFLQNGHWGPIFLSDMDIEGRWGDLGGVEWPLIIWKALTILAIASFALLVWWGSWILIASGRRKASKGQENERSMEIAILGMIVLSVPWMFLFVRPLLDRYWLFLFPPAHLCLASVASRLEWRLPGRSFLFASFTFCAFYIGSLVFTHDLFAWNHARWNYVEARILEGMRPCEIDAGRDVNAWYRMDEDRDTWPRKGDQSKWWSGYARYSIAVGERPGWQPIGSLDWSSWATGRTHHLLLLEKREEKPDDCR